MLIFAIRFRLVASQLHALRGCHPLRISGTLDEFPSTLDWTYERALQDIPDTMWESSHLLLQCVLVSSRPLLVEELAEFLAFDFNTGTLPKLQASCRPEDAEDAVLSMCPGFLSIVEVNDSRIVQFTHSSVKEFLISSHLAKAGNKSSRRYHVDITRAHSTVAKACLRVLLSLDGEVSKDNLKNFPLATYATNHWFDHLKFNNVSQHIKEGVKSLLDPSRPQFAIWISIYDPDRCLLPDPHPKSSSQTERTPLHYAAMYNLPEITDFLASVSWQDINAVGNPHKETSLMVASEMGHVEIVRVLLARGANANTRDHNWWTPLHWASQGGRLEVARLLLDRGADGNTMDKSGRTPLHIASREGRLQNAQLLLEHGASVNAPDKNKRTPLYIALKQECVEVAQLCLEPGADGNTDINQTLVHTASREGRLEVAQLLLECGADADARDDSGQTILHMTSRDGRSEVVQLLLEKRANPNVRDRTKQTPLHVASQEGRLEVAQLLLERGADVDALDRNNRTPLHRVSLTGHIEIAQLLLGRGANVTARDCTGAAPIRLASERNHVEVAQLLRERGGERLFWY